MRIYDLLSLQTGFTPKRCGELHLSHSIFPPYDIITNLVKWLLCSSSTRTPLFCFLMSFLFAAGNVSLSIAGHGSSDWCGNSTKDVCDEMDNDPTTLLKHTPSSSQKFIPQGNQYFFLSAIVELFVECRVVSFSSSPLSDGLSASARSFSAAGAESSGPGGDGWL